VDAGAIRPLRVDGVRTWTSPSRAVRTRLDQGRVTPSMDNGQPIRVPEPLWLWEWLEQEGAHGWELVSVIEQTRRDVTVVLKRPPDDSGER
jgi:hypothetical protein